MALGAPAPASRYRPRLIDLNLIPLEYRRPAFPFVTAGLALLVVGGLILLYAAYYAKTYSDLEIGQLTKRVNQAETLVKSATGDPAALAQRERLRAMRDDYQVLKQRQVNWGDVFQTVGDVPPGVAVKSVGQSGFGVTVTGSAISAAAAAHYLDQLRASNLFVNSTIQMNPSSQPFAVPSAAAPTVPAVSTPPPQGTTAPSAPAANSVPVQPTPVIQPPVVQPPARPPSNPPPSAPQPAPVIVPATKPSATPTATARVTPSITTTTTTTTTRTVSPTPAFDFVLQSQQQVPASNPNVGTTDITGKIVDSTGQLVTGYQVEIDSEGSPPWSAQSLANKEDGTFDFAVGRGSFKVFVLGGSSQEVTHLYTGQNGVAGAFGYQLVFQKTFSGSAAPDAGTVTATPTGTGTASPSPSPVSLGQNVASDGCANAYLVQNGQIVPNSANGSSAKLAIDGNTGTEWNAGVAPSNGTQVVWSWQLYEPGQSPAGCSGAGSSDTAAQINAIQLIPDQNPTGSTTHELWLYSDSACLTNIKTDNSVYYTWEGVTASDQVIYLTLTPIKVRCAIIRTLVDPSFVAWKEVQIYQTVLGVPPPGSTATPNASTPAASASPPIARSPLATFTSTVTSTPTITGTATITPTATVTPTITLTSLPAFFGVNIAPNSRVYTSGTPSASAQACVTPIANPAGHADPCAAIDGSSSTYWAPSPQSHDPQDLTLTYSTPVPVTNPVQDIRFQISSTGTGTQEQFQVWINQSLQPNCSWSSTGTIQDATWYDCSLLVGAGTPTPVPTAIQNVSVRLVNGSQTEDGTYGVREIQVYVPYMQPQSAQPARQVADAVRGILSGLGLGPGDPPTPSAPGAGQPVQPVQPGQYPAPVAPVANQSPPLAATGAGLAPPPPPTTTPAAGISPTGPVDFTIILEVAPGQGYR